ncbi:MAG: cysteine methyltransferase [Burkholderiaceae bacterium]|nr:cysteine methyltransferase [Burkholderiaceae bacterium]
MTEQDAYAAIVLTPFGAIGIQTDVAASKVVKLAFLPPGSTERQPANALAAEAAAQVRRYMEQPDFRFALPLLESGTAFQRAVWREIDAIARGQTATYGAIAKRLGSAPRAVGQACGANPFPLVTPCHRVVAANGGLGGFAGQRDHSHFLLAAKRWLLSHEAHEAA